MQELIGEKVKLKTITEEDLFPLWNLIYGVEEPEWKKWDAPYFPLEHMEFDAFKERQMKRMNEATEPTSWRLIQTKDGKTIGTVSYYWEHKPSNWLEAGIVIYDPCFWNGGYGTEALRMWVNHLFSSLPLVRVGITTWSGNERMMKVAEKIGLQVEGRMRKCRYYNGEYYDSIRMGVLREEWE